MKGRFEDRLLTAISGEFDMATALELSDEILAAEAKGYVLIHREDILWSTLTGQIENTREGMSHVSER